MASNADETAAAAAAAAQPGAPPRAESAGIVEEQEGTAQPSASASASAGTGEGHGGGGESKNESESEKQATDPDVPDAAGDALSSSTVPLGSSAGGDAAEYDPGAAIAPGPDGASDEDGEGGEGDEEEDEGDEAEDEEPKDGGVNGGNDGSGAPDPDSTVPAAPTTTAAAKKPKAVGGFLVGDSDSKDESPPATAVGAAAGADDADDGEEYDPAQLTTDTHGPYESATGVAPAPAPAPAEPPHLATTTMPVILGPAAAAPALAPAPTDYIGTLEARVAEDPRGAVDQWLALIADHRQNNRFEEARSVFNRFLEVFPHAAEVWVDYIEMELELENFAAAEALFARSLTKVVNVPLWVVYLDYVRRRNNLNDAGSEARAVISRAYEFVVDNVGMDKDAGRIWQDYVQFIRSGPGTIGGSGWQDQQKMDQLRKAFRRATSVPIANVNQLWKEYDQFEMGLNKITGRKFLAERSPAYMSAKSANTALDNLTRGLSRTTVPRLPPVAGFEGHDEYMAQVGLWQRWIAWEKSDPLDLAADEPEVLKARILYCYKQALMPLRFWPEMWVDAAEWCFENDVRENGQDKGLALLRDGIDANPESILLALKHADRIESTYPIEDGDDAKIARGLAVRAPYDKVIKTLRDLHKSLQDREKAEVARIEQAGGGGSNGNNNNNVHPSRRHFDDDDDGDENNDRAGGGGGGGRSSDKEQTVALIRQGFAAQMDLVSKCLTHVWIALARAMRRIQGKGSPQGPLGGLRQVFAEARKGGRLKSDIYVAVAKMEWKCYNDKAGGKILERGSKLFPEDPYFMIEYIKYLTAHGDNTNSRVVFETCVNRLAQKPETVHKAKPLLAYMHKREAEYGDLARVAELEKRMAELFPGDSKLAQFSRRFATEKFDPVSARIIVSPAAQLRPRQVLPSVERQQLPPSQRNSPMPPGGGGGGGGRSPRLLQTYLGGGGGGGTNSPKRPYAGDDYDDGHNGGGGGGGGGGNAPPRKILRSAEQREFQRGESPLKGAAGRRLDQQRRLQQQVGGSGGGGGGGGGSISGSLGGGSGGGGGGGYGGHLSGVPAPLPTMVTFLLGQMPPAAQYNGLRLSAPGLVHLLRETDMDPNAAYDAGRRGGGGGGRSHGGGRHGRHVSSADYGYHGSRNSPGPGGGGGGGGRGPSGGYRQSSLRPDVPDVYEPPVPTAGGYVTTAPPPPPAAGGGGAPFEWPVGVPVPQGYGLPQAQAPPAPPYGGYRYQ